MIALLKSIEEGKRIASLDVIRGISIMGILLVNGPTLNGPAIKDSVDFAFQNGLLDSWYTKFIFGFAVGKFYPMFAFLFGLGAAIFMRNSAEKAPGLWLRRLFLLMLLGFCHAFFVWWGDILVVYALLGLMLTPFYNASPRSILRAFWALLAMGVICSIALAIAPDTAELMAKDATEIYQNGSFLAVSLQRAKDFYGVYTPGMFYAVNAHEVLGYAIYFLQLAMLLFLGFYLYRSGLAMALVERKNTARKWVQLMIALTLAVFVMGHSFPSINDIFLPWQGIMQGLLYAAFIVLLCHNQRFLWAMRFFANVGKMSLSNYIFHNIALSLLFYGYGVGLYGRIGPAMQAPILICLMIAALVLSTVWLSRFKFGPLEWLWRAGTYRSLPKLRRHVVEQVRGSETLL